MRSDLQFLFQKALEEGELTYEELALAADCAKTEDLLYYANLIRDKYHGNQVALCAAMNLKSGRCAEDCRYCSQSAHYQTTAPVYEMKDIQEVIAYAREKEQEGISNFELSTSGGALSQIDWEKLLAIYRELSYSTKMHLCGAHGILKSVEEAGQLKEAGLQVYQHNLQASRSFFSHVITTHSYEDRIHTLQYAQKAGLTLCSGCVLGLGEEVRDHIRMALDLRELSISSMPINILNPIPGTPYGDYRVSLTKEEILRIIALYRLALPTVRIIYGAGRIFLEEEQSRAFSGGLNGIVVGNFLTTSGCSISEDIRMIESQNLMVSGVSGYAALGIR